MIKEDSKSMTNTLYINKKGSSSHKNKLKWIVGIVLLLIIIRIALPYIVLRFVNNKLANLKEYYGHVEDVDIALIRGAYVIKDIKLVKIEESKNSTIDTLPFFESPEIDLSVEWRAILKGRVVGEIEVTNPRLNIVKGKHKNEDVKADTADFTTLIKELMPLTVNRFEIKNGEMHYIDNYKKPKVNIEATNLMIIATNLSNVNDSTKLLPAHCDVSSTIYEGTFVMKVDFDAMNKTPTFDMNADIKDVNLVLLNDFLRAYANFDVKKGTFGLYTEFAAKDGKFGGYVKPVLKDLDILQWNKEEGDLKQKLWESIVGGAAEVFQNQKEEQLATKIPINGTFKNTDTNLWRAISYVLRNAFVYALNPTIDKTININKMQEDSDRTFLEKLFNRKKKK